MSFRYFCVAYCNNSAIPSMIQFNMPWEFGFPLKVLAALIFIWKALVKIVTGKLPPVKFPSWSENRPLPPMKMPNRRFSPAYPPRYGLGFGLGVGKGAILRGGGGGHFPCTLLNARKHLQSFHSFMVNVLIWQFHNNNCMQLFINYCSFFRRAVVNIYTCKGDFQKSYFLQRAALL